jgi:hypothetical protein
MAGPYGPNSVAYRTPGYTVLMRNALAISAVCSVIAAGVGCAGDPAATTPGAASFVVVARSRYAELFDAALEAARAERLSPEIADRQSGAILTAPRPAGSLAEPWTWHELTASEVVEGTLAFERRRAYFEFIPSGFRPERRDAAAPLIGPALPGSERAETAPIDSGDGELELRVSVSVERQFRPGYQGSPYTRSMSSFARDVRTPQAGEDGTAPVLEDRSVWTPIARDERLERVLIARIRGILARG